MDAFNDTLESVRGRLSEADQFDADESWKPEHPGALAALEFDAHVALILELADVIRTLDRAYCAEVCKGNMAPQQRVQDFIMDAVRRVDALRESALRRAVDFDKDYGVIGLEQLKKIDLSLLGVPQLERGKHTGTWEPVGDLRVIIQRQAMIPAGPDVYDPDDDDL